MVIADPRQIPQNDLPLFVFSDNTTDFISFLITWRTNGTFNHAMFTRLQGKFVWQGWSYQEGMMDTYMKKGCRLKFFKLVNQTPDTVTDLSAYVTARMKRPWWTKAYDFLGILGQAIGMPGIHTPGLEYCSVDVTAALKSIAPSLPAKDLLVIGAIPSEINPQELHDYMVSNPSVFRIYGEYEFDEGIIV